MPQKNDEIIIRKSNGLITSKYHATLLENQIMSIAISRISVDEKDGIVAKIYPRELSRLTGRHSTNLYTSLRVASKSLVGHSVVIEDGKGNFKAFPIVKYAEYEGGIFTIMFNDQMREFIYGLKNNYTTLNLITMTGFKKNASFRLYELLRKEVYKSDPNVNGGAVTVVYSISELRFILALVNVEEEKVQSELAKYKKGEPVDWDKLYAIASKKDYECWGDLRRHVLIKAQKELEETSDIRFEFKGIRSGREEYKHVEFTIYPNTPTKAPEDIGAKEKILAGTNHQYTIFEVNHQELYQMYVGHHGLTEQDLELFLKTAGEDEEVVRAAIASADQRGELSNYVGCVIDSIEKRIMLYDEYEGHNLLTHKELELFLKTANDDENKVKAAIDMADTQPDIKNYAGWILKAIKDDYTRTHVVEGSHNMALLYEDYLAEYDQRHDTGRTLNIRPDVSVKKKTASVSSGKSKAATINNTDQPADRDDDKTRKIWEKMKSKNADTDEFVQYMGFTSTDDIESIYSYVECIKMYHEWLLGNAGRNKNSSEE